MDLAMRSQASSFSSFMANSAQPCYRYEVFLSFRGEDTRKTFSDHLYNALKQEGIDTFRDDDAMERGRLLKPELEKAIQQSAISLIVFSKDYASSKWCLDEVLMIMEQLERSSFKHGVVPVFYDVKPTDVRNQTGCFKEAFDGYDDIIKAETDLQKKKELLEKVKAWRDSLNKAGSLTGMVLGDGYHAQFITNIVKVIRKKLDYNALYIEDKLVGIKEDVAEIESWLKDPSPNSTVLLIHGMGGIGKSTIAKCIFNSNCRHYEGCCFLGNISEESNQPNGLLRLQTQLLSNILKRGKEETIWNVDEGTTKVMKAICNKRILLVLDDVATSRQLDALLGPRRFHPGSKVIITTRDKSLLNEFEIHPKVQAIERLCDDDSIKLFSLYAFHQDQPLEPYIMMSKVLVTQHCMGLPLALKVLGSYLRGKSIKEWEDARRQLQKSPDPRIQDVLEDKLVGIKDNVAEIEWWLQDPSPNSTILLIHGMGGIGKSTIAKCIFNSNCRHYEGCCFLGNINEESNQPNGLLQLQTQLLSDISKRGKGETIWNVHEGTTKVMKAICSKRILLVLDNVATSRQLDALLGPRRFHPGSKVIITTRDKSLLNEFEIHPKVQAIERLCDDDSIKLFSLYAFHQDQPLEPYIMMSKVLVTQHCMGLPLALKVLGSYLRGKSIKEWEDARRQLQKSPDPRIQDVLEDKLVGIKDNVAEIESWLQDPSPNSTVLLIHGMGGIGKTTIATCVFNSNYREYDGSCFLANINEVSNQPKGLLRLQTRLISKILKREKEETLWDVDEGTTKVINAICSKRILLVLDDVATSLQLDALLGRQTFHPGSKVIITTRDKSLLNEFKIHPKVQAIETLCNDESIKLFSLYAFHQDQPLEPYIILSKVIVTHHCDGLPLALKVLGSYLRGKSIKEWKEAMCRLKSIPLPGIQRVLQLSYESLEEDHDKDLFLHIACFFVGEDEKFIVKLLTECNLYPLMGIKKLSDRCLLYVRYGKVGMHQLIREMGQEVVRQESPKDPGKRTRLWRHEDCIDVLQDNSGTENVEGLMLDMQKTTEANSALSINMDKYSRKRSFEEYQGKTIYENEGNFEIGALDKMKNLMLLQLNYVTFSGECNSLPKKLRLLQWHGFPLKYIPGNILRMLVVLDMSYSKLECIWDDIKFIGSLKVLNLSYCDELMKTPDFRGLPGLESLILKGCKRLTKVDESVGRLNELVLMDITDCINLREFPHLPASLESLEVSGCPYLGVVGGLRS